MELNAVLKNPVDVCRQGISLVLTRMEMDKALLMMRTVTQNFMAAHRELSYYPCQLPAYQEAKFSWISMLIQEFPVKPGQCPFCHYASKNCLKCSYARFHGACYQPGSDYNSLIISLADMVNLSHFEHEPWTENVGLGEISEQAYDLYTVNVLEAAQTINALIDSWRKKFKEDGSFNKIMQDKVCFMSKVLNHLPLEIWDTYAASWRIAAFQEIPISSQFPLEGVKLNDKEINTTLELRKLRGLALAALKNYWRPGDITL